MTAMAHWAAASSGAAEVLLRAGMVVVRPAVGGKVVVERITGKNTNLEDTCIPRGIPPHIPLFMGMQGGGMQG